jgi:hypothetical protein
VLLTYFVLEIALRINAILILWETYLTFISQ